MVSKGIRFFSSGINLSLTTDSLPQPISMCLQTMGWLHSDAVTNCYPISVVSNKQFDSGHSESRI